MTSFASDNYAPAHPEVLAAIAEANAGSAGSYGADPWTEQLAIVVQATFGPDAVAFPVLTGTGANVVSLMAATPRWGGVITTRQAHTNTDENGAPERIGGLKLLTVDTSDAKLTPADLDAYLADVGDVHRAQPSVVSVTQATELGTVYTPAELAAIVRAAHERGWAVHMDGSRLANAAAALDLELRELTTDVGIDLVSFGGTKNGAMLGEAVIVPDAAGPAGSQFAGAIGYLRKFSAQLASKQRFVAAQLLALLGKSPVRAPRVSPDHRIGSLTRTWGEIAGKVPLRGEILRDDDKPGDDPLWLRNARQANAMAALLRSHVEGLPNVTFTQPTQANSLFAIVPRAGAERVRRRFPFYDWAPGPTPGTVEVRWMCAWDTAPADVEAFADAVRAEIARQSA